MSDAQEYLNLEGLMDALKSEETNAGYCFDEAWFNDEHSKTLGEKECESIMNAPDKSIQIACLAIQEGSKYSSSEKGVQQELYKNSSILETPPNASVRN